MLITIFFDSFINKQRIKNFSSCHLRTQELLPYFHIKPLRTPIIGLTLPSEDEPNISLSQESVKNYNEIRNSPRIKPFDFTQIDEIKCRRRANSYNNDKELGRDLGSENEFRPILEALKQLNKEDEECKKKYQTMNF